MGVLAESLDLVSAGTLSSSSSGNEGKWRALLLHLYRLAVTQVSHGSRLAISWAIFGALHPLGPIVSHVPRNRDRLVVGLSDS